MAFRFFTIPIVAPDEPASELNLFLRAHRIVRIDRQWVDQGTLPAWSLCVEYLEGSGGSDWPNKPGSPRARIDYKEILSASDFAVFAKLRDARKAIAQAEAVPVYTVFTNEQLSQMVSSRVATRAALAKIEGVGEARLDKYAAPMLAILETAWKAEAIDHETSGKPV